MELFSDPRTITAEDWPQLQWLVYALWIMLACNVTFACFMLLSHIIIPSMTATGHMKLSAQKMRPALTVIALLVLAGTVCVMLSFVQNLPIIYTIYPHKLN